MVFIIVQVVDDMNLVTEQLSHAHLAEMGTNNGLNTLSPTSGPVGLLTYDNMFSCPNAFGNSAGVSLNYSNWLSGNNNNSGNDSLHQTNQTMPATTNNPTNNNGTDGNDCDDSMI